MRKFGIIAISLVIGIASLPLLSAFAERKDLASGPVVNPDVIASPAADSDPHDEPFVAVSPINDQIIVCVSKDIVGGAASPTRGVSQVAYYFSSDGGLTWGSGLIPLQTPQKTFDFSSDPTVGVDANGVFYLCLLMGSSSSSGSNDGGVYAYKSTDNGHTFGTAIPVAFDVGDVSQNAKIYDKPFLIVDTVPTSPFKNSVYVTWVGNYPPFETQLGGGTRIAHMRPGDAGFSTEQLISHPGNMEGPQLAIGPNGEVYGTWEGIGAPKTLLFDASTDGGVTFDTDIGQPPSHDARLRAFTGALSGPDPAITVPGIARINTWPTIDVDCSNGPHRGTIYIAWAEAINGVNSDICLFAIPPPSGSFPQPGNLVRVSPSGSNQFFPELKVDQQTGTIYIAFCDQAQAAGSSYNTYITSSTDGGATFSPNMRVSTEPSSPIVQSSIIGANSEGIGIGDYIGLAFFNGRSHLVWTDTRNAKQEIFYDRVDFGPGGTTGGGPANDNCSTPKPISSLPFTDSLDTTTATSAASDPANCGGSAGTNSVWYSFTATASTVYGVDTSGSSYDTVLSVYTGSCGSLSRIACNDNFGNNLGNQSLLTFQAESGTTYLIEATGKGSGGSLHLRVGFPTVTSISFTTGPDGSKSLKLNGAGFVVNNAQATVTVSGVDNVLPNSFFTGTTLPDGTTTSMFVSKLKLKKLVKPGISVTVKVESPVGSGSTSVPLSFTR